MNNGVRKLTDGAMMLAIIGVFTLINRQLGGIFDGSLLFLIPLPMVFYSAKYGMRDSWVVLGAMILLTFVLGTPQSLFYMIGEGLIGVVYGSGIYQKEDSGRLLVKTMILGMVVDLLSMVVFASFFGYDLTAEMASMKEMFDRMNEQMGTDLSSVVDVNQFLMEIMVLSALLSGALEGLCTHFISRMMLKRLGFHTEPARPLSSYTLPKWSGYLGLLGLVGYYVSVFHPLENEIAQMALQGLGLAGMYFLVIAGVLGMSHILRKINPNISKGVYILTFLFGILLGVWTAVFGYLYLTTDIKNRLIEMGKRR